MGGDDKIYSTLSLLHTHKNAILPVDPVKHLRCVLASLKNLMDMYASNFREAAYVFIFEGYYIKETQTPDDLEMAADEEIDAIEFAT